MKIRIYLLIMLTIILNICFTGCDSEHEHIFTEATCTSPQTCTICGYSKGSANGHQWQEADCENPKQCTECGLTEGESLGHTTDFGECLRCGEYLGKELVTDEILPIVERIMDFYTQRYELGSIDNSKEKAYRFIISAAQIENDMIPYLDQLATVCGEIDDLQPLKNAAQETKAMISNIEIPKSNSEDIDVYNTQIYFLNEMYFPKEVLFSEIDLLFDRFDIDIEYAEAIYSYTITDVPLTADFIYGTWTFTSMSKKDDNGKLIKKDASGTITLNADGEYDLHIDSSADFSSTIDETGTWIESPTDGVSFLLLSDSETHGLYYTAKSSGCYIEVMIGDILFKALD